MNFLKLVVKYTCLILLLNIQTSYSNNVPIFTSGSFNNISVCQNSTNNRLDTVLKISDADIGQREIWSVFSAPSHGSLAGFNDTLRSTGGIISPSALFYIPSSAYTGADTFKIEVSDSVASSIITIIVTVRNLPTISISPSNPSICLGSNVTLTSAGALNYSWSPSTFLSASTGATVLATPTDTIIYRVTGIDSLGCTNFATDTVIVKNNPSHPTVTATVSYCQNSPDSALTATGVSLLWYNSAAGGAGTATPPMRSTSTAGVRHHYVSQTVNGCESSRDSITVTINSLPSISISPSAAVICNGNDTALTATGAVSYSWLPTTSLSDSIGSSVRAQPSATTIYTVYGTNSLGCSGAATRAVTVNPLPSPIAVTVGGYPALAITCIGHTIDLTSTPGGGTWSNSDTLVAALSTSGATKVVTGIDTGSTVIKYQLSTGCYVTQPISIHEYNLHLGRYPTCTGHAIRVIDGGTGEIWGDYYGTSVASPRTITVSFTYAGGCQVDYYVDVNPMPHPITGRNSVCVGATDTLSNIDTGGTWSSSNPAIATVDMNGVVTGVSPGNVYIHFTLTSRPSRCDTFKQIAVHPLPNILQVSRFVCLGSSVTLNTGGAVSYTWTPSSTLSSSIGSSVSASPTVATTYTVTGVDGNGCVNFTTDTVLVNSVPAPPTVVTPVQYCQNTSASSLIATGANLKWYTTSTGGTGSSAVPTPSTTASGVTKMYVSQTVSGCESARDSITITVLPQPSITFSPSTARVCIGQTITLTASGTSTSYAWSPSSTLTSTSSTAAAVSPTVTSTYTVTGTGANSCMTTVTKTVTVNPLPNITVTPANPTVCLGLPASSTAHGASIYTWSPSGTLSSSTGASVTAATTVTTTYTITGTDTNNCVGSTTNTININSVSTPPVVISPVNICQNSTASPLTASGTSKRWYTSPSGGTGSSTAPTPSTTIVGITTYYVTQTLSGCESPRDSIRVNILRLPTIHISPDTATICKGLDTTLTASGALSYSWIPSSSLSSSTGISVTAIPTITTTYTVTGTDSNNCRSTASRSVKVNNLPNVRVSPSNSTICNATSRTLSASGAQMYIWSAASTLSSTTGANVIASPTVTTVYTITGTDTNGCIKQFLDTVNVTTVPSSPVVTSPLGICLNTTTGSLTATGTSLRWYTTPSGGTSLSSAPVPSTTAIDTTTYYVSQTIGGCESPRDSILVIILPLPVIHVTPDSAVICRGDDTMLTASGGSSYTWSPVASLSTTTGISTNAQPTVTTTYTVTGQGVNGCRDNASVRISVNNLPNVRVTPSSSAICENNSQTLTASGASVYTWVAATTLSASSGASVVASPTVTTIYTVTGTNANGCSNKYLDTITVNIIPSSPATRDTIFYCQNAAATALTATGTALLWYNSRTGGTGSAAAPTPSTASTGLTTYYVSQTVTGCESPRDSTIVIVKPLPTLFISPLSAAICYGLDTELVATGGVTYSWSPSSSVSTSAGASTRAHPSSTTSYTVTGIGSNGCSNTNSRTVVVHPLPSIGISPSAPTICNHTSVSLSAGGGSSYGWSPSVSLSASTGTSIIASPTVTSTYTVTGTDTNGCMNTGIVTVSVNAIPSPPTVSSPVFYCQNAAASPLSAGGSGLQWYSSAFGGTASGTPPTPSTNVVDTLTFYVSQTVLDCESPRDSIRVIIKPLPAIATTFPITSICYSADTTLTATGGLTYSWAPSTYLSATTGSSVVANPIATTVYTVTGTGSNSCTDTASLTVVVNPLPRPIEGATFVCIGESKVLRDSSAGGNWISTDTTIAAISVTGTITGVSVGAAVIIYQLPTGCMVVDTIPVNTFPSVITGTPNVCPYDTVRLSDSTSGGSWSVSASGIISVTALGEVIGLTPGTDTAIYTMPSGCARSMPITVNSLPAAISGDSVVCVNGVIILTSSSSGGTWHNSDTSVGGLTGSGIYTGISSGMSTISYELSTGCKVTHRVRVNPLPGAITGPNSVCPGQHITVADTTTGGTWISQFSSIATVSTTGVVTGVIAGTDSIFYVLPTGCKSDHFITVNPLPANIEGLSSVCVGSSIVLSDSTSGGNWSVTDPILATISLTGMVTGILQGADTIVYTLPTTCFVKFPITVNPLPATITGAVAACAGLSAVVTDSTSGGTWSSLYPLIATINAAGIVTGLTPGTDTIQYTLSTGCYKQTSFAVNPLPANIEGTDSICIGLSTMMTDSAGGGTWTITQPTISTISSSGILTGITAGIDTVIYTLPTGCLQSLPVRVNPLPSPILGNDSVCVGATSTLYDMTPGGAWSSVNPSIASINLTGVVSGIRAGIDTMVYTLPTGCIQQLPFRVNPLPAPLFGDSTACVGRTILLTDSVGTLMYSVYAVTPGTLTITLSTLSACNSHISVLVYPNPGPITGTTGLCLGTSSALADSVTGGAWSSSDTNVAIVSLTGLVYGRSVGTAIISYTLSTGCYTTTPVYVNTLFTIGGMTATNPSTCLGNNGNISLSGLGAGITYSVNYFRNGSPFLRMKTADSAGILVIDSLQAGIYTHINVALSGCTSNSVDTVLFDPPNPAIPVLGSNSPVCHNTTLYLNSTDATPGVSYMWTGTAGFTSTLQNCSITALPASDSGFFKLRVEKNSCFASDSIYIQTLTVPIVLSISGPSLVCLGSVNVMADSISGGHWTSSGSHISIDSVTGVFNAASYGNDTALYIKGNICGADTAFKPVFVDRIPLIDTITGVDKICVGASASFTNSTAGGHWFTVNGRVSISSSGLLTGLAPGIDTVLYVVGNSCGNDTVSKIVAIIPLPDAGIISGPSSVCELSSISISSSVTGGSWHTAAASIASVDNAGNVYGIHFGSAVLFYVYSNFCGTDTVYDTVLVNPLPHAGAVLAVSSLCTGATAIAASNVTGGYWSSTNSAIASISGFSVVNDSAVIWGVSPGNAIIRYIVINICGSDTTTHSLTVNPLPILSSPLFPPAICSGTTFNYMPISISSGATFAWKRLTSSGITNNIDSGYGTISETLNSISVLPLSVSYNIVVSALGCSNLQLVTATVKPIPRLNSADSLIICSGTSVNYLATSATPGTNFLWSRNVTAGISPLTGNGTNYISEILTNSTDSSIHLKYTFILNADGCSATEYVYITVEQRVPPKPIITTMSPSYVCLNTMYQNFGAATKPPIGTTYYWTASGAEVWATGMDRQYSLVNFREQGLAWVILSSTYSGNVCASKDSFAVLVNGHYISDTPEVTYFHPVFVCERNDQYSYQWGYDDRETLDSSLIVGETNQGYINDNPDFTHKHYWVMTKHYDCMQKTYLIVPMTVEEANKSRLDCTIYPNPNSGDFTMNVTSDLTEEGSIVITNLLGQKLSEWSFITNTPIDMHLNITPGIYLATIETSHGKVVRKVIIN